MNPYSPQFGYIRAFEKSVRDAQFPFYLQRFLGVYRKVRNIYTPDDFIKLLTAAYRRDRASSHGRNLETVIPDGKKRRSGRQLNTDAAFVYNALSIYGPARLRKGLTP